MELHVYVYTNDDRRKRSVGDVIKPGYYPQEGESFIFRSMTLCVKDVYIDYDAMVYKVICDEV